jgi:hypothetical protein
MTYREKLLEVGVEAEKRPLAEVLKVLMTSRGIEDLEDLHRRFLETGHAYIPIPGRHRGKQVPFEEFKAHLEGRQPRPYPELLAGLREVLAPVTMEERLALTISYALGPPGSFTEREASRR